ncbi:hypothetical protein Ciccas_009968 [Cichlidogyrus casuarinus]|uniref:Hexosyltransferase n=1 Tax=Cichlidogyrus casuarinus TaxID=1844966 RepID=A0ABD2PVQ7_9PLAT
MYGIPSNLMHSKVRLQMLSVRVHRISAIIFEALKRFFRRYHFLILLLTALFILWGEVKNIYYWSKLKSLDEFQYPQYGDMYKYLEEYHAQSALNWSSADNVSRPINFLQYTLTNFDESIHGSKNDYHIINIVKSQVDNVKNRDMIRKTWANSKCTFNKVAKVRTFFLMGEMPENQRDKDKMLIEEAQKYKDILRYSLVDSYYNNTYKFMVALDLIGDKYPGSKFLIVTDDDYFIHPPNLYEYLESIHPARYPFYVGGSVWYNAQPLRGVDEKWRISLDDYPFSHFPDYPTGGNLIISTPMARSLAIGMQYVKYMDFDDVLLGIVLFKLGVAPDNIRSMCKSREQCDPNRVDKVISSHGFRDPNELHIEWDLHRFYEFC